jgi:hypothetical protein
LRIAGAVAPEGGTITDDQMENDHPEPLWYHTAVLECARCGRRDAVTFAVPDTDAPPPDVAVRSRPRDDVYIFQHLDLRDLFFEETDDFFERFQEGPYAFRPPADAPPGTPELNMRVTPLPLRGTVRSVVLQFDTPRAPTECYAAVAAETEARKLVWFTSERTLRYDTREPAAAFCGWMPGQNKGDAPAHAYIATLPSTDPEVFLDFVEARLA